MNGTESEGFEPEGELDLGIPSQDITAALSRAAVLADLPAKWRAEAAAMWNGDETFPAGYIDGIQRRRTAQVKLDDAEELEAAIAALGGGTP